MVPYYLSETSYCSHWCKRDLPKCSQNQKSPLIKIFQWLLMAFRIRADGLDLTLRVDPDRNSGVWGILLTLSSCTSHHQHGSQCGLHLCSCQSCAPIRAVLPSELCSHQSCACLCMPFSQNTVITCLSSHTLSTGFLWQSLGLVCPVSLVPDTS
jgi:hypothetical protein